MAMPPAPNELPYGAPYTAAEHRQRVQHAAAERAATRVSELAAQASPMKNAEERIRIWEQLHALHLPRASGHVLVRVIATQTRLTIAQVHGEQRRRAAMTAPPKALPAEGCAFPRSEPVQAEEPAAPLREG